VILARFPRPSCGSSQFSSKPLSWILKVLLLREKRRKEKNGEERRSKEKKRKHERGE